MARSCRAITGLLSAYLDGEVTPEQARRCDEHLATCAECRAELASLESARSLLRSMLEPVVPVSLPSVIKAAAAAELSGGREAPLLLWPSWATGVAAAAALVVAITAGYMLRAPDLMPTGELAFDPAPATILEPLDVASPTPADVATEPETMLAAVPIEDASPVAPRRRASSARTDVAAPPAADDTPAPAPTVEDPAPPISFALAAVTGPADALATAATVRPTAAAAASLALTPRLTPVEREIGDPVTAPGPSSLELEMAAGVVASMLIDDFVGEYLIESTPTLLSVATGTPSADLGATLVEAEDDARFELCFTEAMRRALAGRGE